MCDHRMFNDPLIRDATEQLTAERNDLRATVERVEALFAGGPGTPCRIVWDDEGTKCVSVPLDDLRAALSGANECAYVTPGAGPCEVCINEAAREGDS